MNRRGLLLLFAWIAASPTVRAGAWSHESFENDGALDWVEEFKQKSNSAFVRQALVRAASGKYIGNYAGECAIAAAEVVAASLGSPCKGFPKELASVVARLQSELRALAPLARAVIVGVLGSKSELRKGWSLHAEDLAKWEASVNDLQARLSRESA